MSVRPYTPGSLAAGTLKKMASQDRRYWPFKGKDDHLVLGQGRVILGRLRPSLGRPPFFSLTRPLSLGFVVASPEPLRRLRGRRQLLYLISLRL